MRKRGLTLLGVLSVGAAVACQTTLQLPTGTVTPTGSSTPGPAPTASIVASTVALNQCYPIQSTGNTGVTLGATPSPAWNPGDLVLLWQVTIPAQPPLENLQGTLSSSQLLSAGSYQLVHLKDPGTPPVFPVATIDSSALQNFRTDPTGNAAQACRLPVFTTLTVATGGTITAGAWNGSVGGVVAFQTLQSTTLFATDSISVSAAGFAGGPLSAATPPSSLGDPAMVCSANTAVSGAPNLEPGTGGAKGGGVFDLAPLAAGTSLFGFGAGNFGNAAGGGDFGETGGGGGASIGSGGRGGQFGSGGACASGSGGRPLTPAPARLVIMGGGGGAGCCLADGTSPSAGANGGGVVLVITSSLSGTGSIFADGASAAPAGAGAGAGGGGAGGAVLLLFTSAQGFGGTSGDFAGTVSAQGGAGGPTLASGVAPDPGQGAGGGGGLIAVTRPLPIAATLQVGAGTFGHAPGGNGNGARAGEAGMVVTTAAIATP